MGSYRAGLFNVTTVYVYVYNYLCCVQYIQCTMYTHIRKLNLRQSRMYFETILVYGLIFQVCSICQPSYTHSGYNNIITLYNTGKHTILLFDLFEIKVNFIMMECSIFDIASMAFVYSIPILAYFQWCVSQALTFRYTKPSDCHKKKVNYNTSNGTKVVLDSRRRVYIQPSTN